MAYTQAYPLEDAVQKAFDLKVKLLEARASGGSGSEESTYYYNARTPWIRMTSCVNLIGQSLRDKFQVGTASELASKYILGTTKPGGAFAGHNYDRAYGVEDSSYGIRPQPGITNMDVMSYNKYGSLRKATINFQVWTKEDLDACEILYMRPGMSVLLEWGWSLYLTGSGTDEDPFRVRDMGKGLDVIKPEVKGLHPALSKIRQKQEKYNYGYDAILGFVKNFKWSIRPDGGYDCVTELITAGELVESFNMAKPLADDDVDVYEKIIANVQNNLTGEAVKAGTKYLGRPAFGSASFRVDEDGKVYQQAMAKLKDIPSPNTQTFLSGFLHYDVKLLADIIFEGQLSKEEKNVPTLQYLGISTLAVDQKAKGKDENGREYSPPISTRIANKRGYESEDDILRINWVDPVYAADTNGTVQLTDDGTDFEVTAERSPQTYIKYGLVLEILNNFMLQHGEDTLTPFDINTPSEFSVLKNVTISIDPSVCILPAEEAILRQASNRSSNPEEELVSANIYDIRINTLLLEDLVSSSGLMKVGQEGTPTLRIFDMIQTLNSKINESTGNLLHLDIQYYDHLGYFSIVDRKTFFSTKTYYKLDIFGLKSLMHSINISSALTPEMSSAVALSAQTKLTNADSHSAGFLRFNEGIQDRVITDRGLDGVVVKNREYANTRKEEYSEIFTLYELIYNQLIWAEANFPYAKTKFIEFVKQITGNTDDGFVGQVVIPFVSELTMDGMSGFRIMNGFTLDPKVLPYKYDIKGGAGQLITGLQTTVDSTNWKTTIKSQFYNLEAGSLSKEVFPPAGYIEDDNDITDNYVYKFAEEISGLGYEYYSTYTTTFLTRDILEEFFAGIGANIGKLPNQIIEGTYDEWRIKDLQWMIDHHYNEFWGQESVKESEDAQKSRGNENFVIGNIPVRVGKEDRGPRPEVTSALQMYWVNYKKGFAQTEIWQNHSKYPWSAVYISFMMGKVDLTPKLGTKVTTGSVEQPITLLDYQGYGSPQWVKSEGHYSYTSFARTVRKAKRKGGYWVAFALRDLYTENKEAENDVLVGRFAKPNVPYLVPIRAQAGDILVKPRKGGYYKSHGAIVADVKEDGSLVLAHGNMGNTNRLETVQGFADKNEYYLPDNPQGYLLVLKRFE